MMSNLDVGEVHRQLSGSTIARLDRFETFASIDSTNTYLLGQAAPDAGWFRVAVADEQTGGRGRDSRHWVSPPGAGLYLSLAYTFARTPPALPGLTLALGVGVIGALDGFGRDELRLKWPNDIVVRDGKLGGILTEAKSLQGGGVSVVAGLGLNIDLPEDLAPPPGRSRVLPAVDMASVFETVPPRERLAGSLVEALVESMVRFEASGFDAFAAAWRRYDWLHGRRVVVELAGEEISGIASGVEADGALVLDGPDGRTRIISGSISKVSGAGEPA